MVVVCIPLFLITLHSTGGVVVDEMLAMNYALAKDLVAQNPNIIVAVSGEALFATAQATTTIPIVSATGGGDLVKAGLIQSLRPGGNVTGMWLTSDEAAALRRSA